MTYKEFQEHINKLNDSYNTNFRAWIYGQSTLVDTHDTTVAKISNKIPYCVDTQHLGAFIYNDNLRHDLLSVVYEFTQTPIESRNLQPKYWIASRLTPDDYGRFLFKRDGNIDCLAWGVQGGKHFKFTEAEIYYIKNKFHVDLKDCEIIEVEE